MNFCENFTDSYDKEEFQGILSQWLTRKFFQEEVLKIHEDTRDEFGMPIDDVLTKAKKKLYTGSFSGERRFSYKERGINRTCYEWRDVSLCSCRRVAYGGQPGNFCGIEAKVCRQIKGLQKDYPLQGPCETRYQKHSLKYDLTDGSVFLKTCKRHMTLALKKQTETDFLDAQVRAWGYDWQNGYLIRTKDKSYMRDRVSHMIIGGKRSEAIVFQ